MNAIKNKKAKGFTLIEILVVIGMIALLATIVIIAINPSRQFAQSRNSQRVSNVNAILNAVGQNIADNKGIFNCPAQPTTTPADIKSGSGNMNIMPCIVPTYLSSILTDPKMGSSTDVTAYDTHYSISSDANNRITVQADDAELNQTILVSR
jgi:prepilin-type N-terminal cleavage/methylation domain-containing protein